jgi:hypothetical protein
MTTSALRAFFNHSPLVSVKSAAAMTAGEEVEFLT